MTKLGGHTVKMWRRRFFSFDQETGNLQYCKDDSGKGAVLGVINIPNILYVTVPTDRGDAGGGMWPTGVPTKRCLQIVTPTRTFSMYCDRSADTQRWIHTLRLSTDRGCTSYGGIEIDMTIAEGQAPDAAVTTTGTMLLTDAVKVRATPELAVPTTAEDDRIEALVQHYNLANVSTAARNNIIRWHAVMETSLATLNKAFQLGQDDGFVLLCDLGEIYNVTLPSIQRRLGEYILSDYLGELCHNLAKLAEEPIGQQSVLQALTDRCIRLQGDPSMGDGYSPATQSQLDTDSLLVLLNPARLGYQSHMVGRDFITSLLVTSAAQEHQLQVRKAQIQQQRRSTTPDKIAKDQAHSDKDLQERQSIASNASTTATTNTENSVSEDAISRGSSPANQSDSGQSSRSDAEVATAAKPVVSGNEERSKDYALASLTPWYAGFTGVRVPIAVDALGAEAQLDDAAKKLKRWIPGLRGTHLVVQWKELDDVIKLLAKGQDIIMRGFGKIVIGQIVPTVLSNLAALCRQDKECRAAVLSCCSATGGVLGVQVRAPRKNPESSRKLLQLRFRARALSLVIGVYPARIPERSGADLETEMLKVNLLGWLKEAKKQL